MLSRTDALHILELDGAASPDQVKRAYRQLAKVWHPDRFAEVDAELREKATRKLAEINAAYELLKDVSPQRPHQATSSPQRPQPTPQPSPKPWPRAFDADLRDGDDAEIVAISPDDDYFGRQQFFLGCRVTLRNPIHKGNGWYCAHAIFRSGSKQLATFADGALFANVQLRRA